MLINEDSAESYASALKKVINGNYYAFNKKRAETFRNTKGANGKRIEDKFNFNYSGEFTSRVLDYFEKNFPILFHKYKSDITDAANDYFKLKKKEEKFFNY